MKNLLLFSMISCILLLACQRADDQQPMVQAGHAVVVEEVVQANAYTYLNVSENGETFWIAITKSDVAKGDKLYYENGKLKAQIPYKNGKKEGIAKGYYENGKLLEELSYKNNMREGIDKQYYESGKIKYVDTYKSDRLILREVYDETGKLKLRQDLPGEKNKPQMGTS